MLSWIFKIVKNFVIDSIANAAHRFTFVLVRQQRDNLGREIAEELQANCRTDQRARAAVQKFVGLREASEQRAGENGSSGFIRIHYSFLTASAAVTLMDLIFDRSPAASEPKAKRVQAKRADGGLTKSGRSPMLRWDVKKGSL